MIIDQKKSFQLLARYTALVFTSGSLWRNPVSINTARVPMPKWARFSLRRLFIVYTMIACCIVAMAWQANAVHKELQSEQNALKNLSGYNSVKYTNRSFGIGRSVLKMISTDNFDTQNIIEIDADGCEVTDEQIEQLEHFRFLEKLNLGASPIGDRAVESISRSRYADRLRFLNLFETNISDESLSLLNNLDSLESLFLDSTNISDDGLSKLKNKSIRKLYLYDTDITDNGLIHIADELQVNELGITGPKCTVDGVERFLSRRNNSESKIAVLMWDIKITDEQKRDLQVKYPNSEMQYNYTDE